MPMMLTVKERSGRHMHIQTLKKLFSCLVLLSHVTAIIPVLAQQVPPLINYQGRLLEGTNLVNGVHAISLRIFDQSSGGTRVYEDSNSVTVIDGLYSTLIGDDATLGQLDQALTNNPVWLEVMINGVALSPRERIVSVAYAMNADTLDALDSGQFLQSDAPDAHTSGGLTIGTGSFLNVQGSLRVYGADASDNDGIFFDNTTNEFFRWNNAAVRFEVSDDVAVLGTIAVGSLGLGPRPYSRFGASNTTHGLSSSNDLLVTGDVEVDGAIFADGLVQIASGNPGEGKILTSDFNGVVRWEDNPIRLFGLDFSAFVPEVIDNSVKMEISGVGTIFTGLVVNGPGYTMERIPGFTGLGQPDDESGLNAELPLIFDASGSITNALNSWHVNYTNNSDTTPRDMSLIVTDIGGSEAYRINLFSIYPTSVSTGLSGRTRYTVLNTLSPNMVAHVDRDPAGFGLATSFNTNTDRRIEISGISVGPYPSVVITPTNRTVTLTFDYGEGGSALGWVKDIAQSGTLSSGKRDLSVIYETFNGTNFVENVRTNFFGVFPIHYQAISLGLDIKSKERLTLSYDFEEGVVP